MRDRKFLIGLIVVIVVIAILVIAGAIYFAHEAQAPAPSGQACTLEAKICPDGTTVGRTGPNCAFAACPSTADTSGWTTYTNSTYGITLKYPPSWQRSNDPLNAITPYVFFGNPLSGKATYSMKLFAYNNPLGLSPEAFVAKMLADDAAQDASNTAKNGPGPQITPQFKSQYALMIGNYSAYELDQVFEFDHNAEQIYIADGSAMLVFDFPVSDENPNIASPAENNAAAHEILATLQLAK